MSVPSGAVLEALHARRTNEIVVTTMASVRPWGHMSESEFDFASADSAMGHAADFALGIAIAQPDRRVICLNGDGSLLMSLGTLATIVDADVANFVLIVMDNGGYEITGNQKTPAGGRLEFQTIAKAAGFPSVLGCDSEPDVPNTVETALASPGPVFASFVVQPGSEGPITRSPKEAAPYLRASLAESAHQLRDALRKHGPVRLGTDSSA